MRHLIPWLRVAGVLQLAILLASCFLPGILRCRENLTHVSPMIREVFIVQWAYIAMVLAVFASLSLWFASDLAGATPVGRFLSAVLAVFWLVRVPIQLFFYDRELRRNNRIGDVMFLLVFSYLGAVFSVAALGVVR